MREIEKVSKNRLLCFLLICVLIFQLSSVALVKDTSAYDEFITHKFILEQARTILRNDDATYHTAPYANFLDSVYDPSTGETYLQRMIEGVIYADHTLFMRSKHSMDPVDHKGHRLWLLQFDCAGKLCQEKFDEAVIKWIIGDKAEAMYELGWATHLVQDVCVPQHAFPWPIDAGHGDYEKWVEEHQDDYKVNSGGIYSFDSFPDYQYYPLDPPYPMHFVWWDTWNTPFDWVDYNAHESYRYYGCVNKVKNDWVTDEWDVNGYGGAGYVVETVHPVPNGISTQWTVKVYLASKIRVHFEKIDMKEGDYVDVHHDGGIIYLGKHYDEWTPVVPGDTVEIRLFTTGGPTDPHSWGYKIDKIEFWDTGEWNELATEILLKRAQRTTAGFIVSFFKALNAIWSSDSDGYERNEFPCTETVYVTVQATGQTVRLYVVEHKDEWNVGDTLTDVSGGYEQLTLNNWPHGAQIVPIWQPPLSLGCVYDIVEDFNCNGEYDEGDSIDSFVVVAPTHATSLEIISGQYAIVDRSPNGSHSDFVTFKVNVKDAVTDEYLAWVGIVKFYVAGTYVGSDTDTDYDGIYEFTWDPPLSWLSLGSQPWEAKFTDVNYEPSSIASSLTLHGVIRPEGLGIMWSPLDFGIDNYVGGPCNAPPGYLPTIVYNILSLVDDAGNGVTRNVNYTVSEEGDWSAADNLAGETIMAILTISGINTHCGSFNAQAPYTVHAKLADWIVTWTPWGDGIDNWGLPNFCGGPTVEIFHVEVFDSLGNTIPFGQYSLVESGDWDASGKDAGATMSAMVTLFPGPNLHDTLPPKSKDYTVHGQLSNALISPVGGNYEFDADIPINVTVTSDKAAEGNIEGCTVTATLTAPDGTTYSVSLTDPPIIDGVYEGTFKTKKIGWWKIEVTSTKDNYHDGVSTHNNAFKVKEYPFSVQPGILNFKLGPGESAASLITLINGGGKQITEISEVAYGDPAAPWITSEVPPSIDPNEEAEGCVYVNVPDDIPPGKYTATLKFTGKVDPEGTTTTTTTYVEVSCETGVIVNVPEFLATLPLITSLAACSYLLISKKFNRVKLSGSRRREEE